MFQSLGVPALLTIFIASAAVIWVAGVKLSNATDVLSRRFGLGQALGGVILLAIATNLPEIATTASAAWSGNVGVAVGNILGGIAIQTVVLVDGLADAIGMSGILFGATVLRAATSLPELSTGLASMKLKDYQLAIRDILGGNAFLPVLFLLATLVSGKAVLPGASAADPYLAGLAVLLTGIYLAGLIFRPSAACSAWG